MSSSMEEEFQKKHKISYATAHTCVEGAKKQLGMTVTAEPTAEQRQQIMTKAEEIYSKLPTTTGEVSAAQPIYFQKTVEGLAEFGKDTAKFLGEKAEAAKFTLGLEDKNKKKEPVEVKRKEGEGGVF